MSIPRYRFVAVPKHIREDYRDTINELTNGETGTNIERLHGWSHDGCPIVSMRANKKSRLLFSYLTFQDKTILRFYKALPNHEYESAKKSLRESEKQKNINGHVQAIPSELEQHELLKNMMLLPVNLPEFEVAGPEFETADTDERVIKTNKADPRIIYFQDHFIYLDDEQQKVLLGTKRWPLVISGPPGSGKTCVTAGLLISWLLEADKQALFTSQEPCSSSSSTSRNPSSSSEPASSHSSYDHFSDAITPTFAYITESLDLRNRMAETMSTQPGLDRLQTHIHYSNYNDLLKQVDPNTQNKYFLSKKESKQRFFEHDNLQLFLRCLQPKPEKSSCGKGKNKKAPTTPANIAADNLLKQKLYQEALMMAGCGSLEDYLDQGKVSSQFADLSEAIRTNLYHAFLTYQDNLKIARMSYQKILKMAGYHSLESYLGRDKAKTSLIDLPDEITTKLHAETSSMPSRHLKGIYLREAVSVIDPLLYRPSTRLMPRFLGAVIDETQDYVPIQTWVLQQVTMDKRMASCVDTHQNIGAATCSSIRHYLKHYLGADNTSFDFSYRCPNNIIDIANVALKLKGQIVKGLADSDDYPEISRTPEDRKKCKSGYVTFTSTKASHPKEPALCLPQGEALERLKQAAQGSASVAIVTRSDLVESLQALLGNARVFSPQQIKGLEFDTIYTWDILRDSRFHDANSALPDDSLSGTNPRHRPKDKTTNVEIADSVTALCELFTLLTRSTRALHFNEPAEPEDEHYVGKITQALQKTIAEFASNTEEDGDKPLPSTPEELINLMNRLIRRENDAAAKIIWQDKDTWKVPENQKTDSYETYKRKLLGLPNPVEISKIATTTIPSSSSSLSSSSPSSSTANHHPSIPSGPRHNRNHRRHVKKAPIPSHVNQAPKSAPAKTASTRTKTPLGSSNNSHNTAAADTNWHAAMISHARMKQNWETIIPQYQRLAESEALHTLRLVDLDIVSPTDLKTRREGIKQLFQLAKSPSMRISSHTSASAPALHILLNHNTQIIADIEQWFIDSSLEQLQALFANGDMLFLLCSTSTLLFNFASWLQKIPALAMAISSAALLRKLPLRKKEAPALSAFELLVETDSVFEIFEIWLEKNPSQLDIHMQRALEPFMESGSIFIPPKLKQQLSALKTHTMPDVITDTPPVAKPIEPMLGIKPRLHRAAVTSNLQVLATELANGTDIDAVDEHGKTALHYACQAGHSNVVTYLIEMGADIDKADKLGATPLHVATSTQNTEIMRLLLEAWTYVDKQSHMGLTPLHLAVHTNHLENARLLMTHEANLNIKDTAGHDKTPLIMAAEKENIVLFNELVRAGANVNVQDAQGFSALHFISNIGNLDLVKLLLDHGANPNLQENRGKNTPVYVAITQDRTESLKAMLATGRVNLELKNKLGKTALQVAQDLGKTEMVQIINDHMALPFKTYTKAIDWRSIVIADAKTKKDWETVISRFNKEPSTQGIAALTLSDLDIKSPNTLKNRKEGLNQLFHLLKTKLTLEANTALTESVCTLAANQILSSQPFYSESTITSTTSADINTLSVSAFEILFEHNQIIVIEILEWIKSSSLEELEQLFDNGDMMLLFCSLPKLLRAFDDMLSSTPHVMSAMKMTFLQGENQIPVLDSACNMHSINISAYDLLTKTQMGCDILTDWESKMALHDSQQFDVEEGTPCEHNTYEPTTFITPFSSSMFSPASSSEPSPVASSSSRITAMQSRYES